MKWGDYKRKKKRKREIPQGNQYECELAQALKEEPAVNVFT